MRNYPGPGMGGSLLWGFMGFVGTLAVLGLITLLVIYLVKRSNGRKFGPGPSGQPAHHRPGAYPAMPPAMQVLDERLARGEIEVEDYMTRRAALLGNAGTVPNEWRPGMATPPQPEGTPPPSGDSPSA